MKRLMNVLLAVVLFIIFVIAYYPYISNQLDIYLQNNRESLVYWSEDYRFDLDKRNADIDIMRGLLNDDTCIVFGSSELHATNDLSFPTTLYKNNDAEEFDMLMIGDSYCQTLVHTLEIGALDKSIPRSKVVLVLSPQWFETSQPSEIFSSLFNYNAFVELLKNDSIPNDLKCAVAERVISQLSKDEKLSEKASRAYSVYLKDAKNPLKLITVELENRFQMYRSKYRLLNILKKMDFTEKPINKKVDYDELILAGDKRAKELSDNEFHALDYYYDVWSNSDFLQENLFSGYEFNSSEYYDLSLFLRVCAKTNTEVLVVNVPCQGWVYDYLGWSQDARNNYYDKIKVICEEYEARVADFSDQEYNEGFIRDSMHLGYEGWACVGKAIYEYFYDEY